MNTKKHCLTLGSLFDGIAGFPLAAAMNGIQTLWASDIDKQCETVSKHHFPEALQLGDIMTIDGREITPVDIISFGSPCQDLSVAGKREGMKHEEMGDEETTRSGLFYEAIRITKEMREKTNGEKPRYIIWENVPGAYSSNKGEDFRQVLCEVCAIKEPTDIPKPKGGWNRAGLIVADGWSVAWRTLDAQYWGVPQRRRRIFLVADFTGERAGKILFEPKSVPRDYTQGGKTGQGAAADTAGSAERTGGQLICSATQQGGAERFDNLCPTITSAAGTSGNNQPWICKAQNVKSFDGYNGAVDDVQSSLGVNCLTPHDNQSARIYDEKGVYPALSAGEKSGLNRQGVLVSVINDQGGQSISIDEQGEQSPTLSGQRHDASVVLYEPKSAMDENWAERKTKNALRAGASKSSEALVYTLQGNGIDRADTAGCNGKGWRENESYTLNTIDRHGVVYAQKGFGEFNNDKPTIRASGGDYDGGSEPMAIVKEPVKRKYIVRRLTPTECERLQGFPDGWTDIEHNGKPMSDSARYRMLGNSIAVPCAEFIFRKIRAENERY